MKKDTTPAGIAATGIKAAWENVTVSFERFCLTAGVATHAEMMERAAAKLCGPRYRRNSDRRGHRWGRTAGKLGFHDGQSVKTTERGGVRGFDGYKRVKGGSDTSWLTFSAFRSPTALSQPTCRTAELAAGYWQASHRSGQPFAPSLLMQGMRVANLLGICSAADCACRSSSVNSERSRLRVSLGLLSGPSHGSASTAASRKSTSTASRHQKHCSTSLRFA